MISLVLELQRDALDKSIPVADLLRKAFVVARKLKITDAIYWISNELNGYGDGSTLPEYRKLHGELRVHSPYQGWVPLMMSDPEHGELLARRPTSQPISELENIFNGEAGMIYVKLPKSIEKSLMAGMEDPMEPAVFLSKSQVHGLLDRVRNSVLDWALGLEETGITGEGMSFSPEEQKQASSMTFNISHLGNLIGSMSESQIQQGTNGSTQEYSKPIDLGGVSSLIEQLVELIPGGNLSSPAETQIQSDIACIKAQLSAPTPNAGIIRESLRSTRSILEGIASSAVFQGIVNSIATYL